MKVIITIEDTPKGLSVDAVKQLNGTLDHPSDSIALIMLARIASLFIKARANEGLRPEGNLML